MFKHVLVPFDGGGRSFAALAQAVEIARGSGASVTVLYVLRGPAERADAEKMVMRAVARASYPRTRGLVREAKGRTIAGVILDEVDAEGASLVVMGSSGRGEFVTDSVAHTVARYAPTSVLLTHAPSVIYDDAEPELAHG